MKKYWFFVILLLLLTNASFAQKFGYVDSEFILSKMPAYKSAQQEIDKLSANWQKDIEGMYQNIDKMYKAYQAEEVLLTEEMKKKRQNEIVEKEKEVKEYQKKIFGFEGTVFKKRQELIKPVQDEVYDAIEKVAKKRQLQIIFDKSGELVMLYTNPVHDYTEYVLEELGLASPEKNTAGARPNTSNVDTPGSQVQSQDGDDVGASDENATTQKQAPAARKTTGTKAPAKTQPKKK
ncbi:OmpH family outer membrane protein [Adhaeribacter radiodurans]|uniref:OmpH family outer membrane protein n=1 Tax=Adhaeribacter radiodurans TaxID=2745197 RepID=A0A7L7L2G7_9BACT|nr:OmpH family outer membrane protein [Adhaeribacter radiodurans]QMU26997.1 OmpH family outer membrane protein [Adhaeribacter radiodurans]